MLIQHLFVAIPAFLVANSVYRLVRRRDGRTLTAIGILLIGIVLLSLGVLQLSGQYRQHSFLQQLTVQGIEIIMIDGRQISDPGTLTKFVDSLNESKWVSSHNGSTAANSVHLSIHMHSGRVYEYSASKYLKGPSAVIKFRNGAALVPRLDSLIATYMPRSSTF